MLSLMIIVFIFPHGFIATVSKSRVKIFMICGMKSQIHFVWLINSEKLFLYNINRCEGYLMNIIVWRIEFEKKTGLTDIPTGQPVRITDNTVVRPRTHGYHRPIELQDKMESIILLGIRAPNLFGILAAATFDSVGGHLFDLRLLYDKVIFRPGMQVDEDSVPLSLLREREPTETASCRGGYSCAWIS